MANVIKDGWLTKQGGRVKSWKRRFFRLTSAPGLVYYESAHAGRPKGSVALTAFTTVAEADELGAKLKRQFVFTVQSTPETRSYVIFAESGEERRQWVEAIRRVVADEAARFPEGRPGQGPLYGGPSDASLDVGASPGTSPSATAAAMAEGGSSGDEVDKARGSLADLELHAEADNNLLQRRSTIAADVRAHNGKAAEHSSLDGSTILGKGSVQDCLDRLDALMPQLAEALNSDQLDTRLDAAVATRKLLSIESRPPIEECVAAGLVPVLCRFLAEHETPALQFEAAWALTNVASGSAQHTRHLVDQDVVPLLRDLLDSPQADVREQAVWGLGNIAGDSCAMRDVVLASGAFQGLLEALGQQLEAGGGGVERQSFLRNLTWTLSNMIRGKSPPPDFALVCEALPMLRRLIMLDDVEVLTDACWALSYLSDGTAERIQAVVDAAVVPRMVELLGHEQSQIHTPALRVVGNVVTGSSAQVAVVLRSGVLERLAHLLDGPNPSLKREACWTVSNVTADGAEHCQHVLDSGIITKLIDVLRGGSVHERQEAAWAVSNLFETGSEAQAQAVVDMGAIAPMCDLLFERVSAAVQTSILDGLLRAAAHTGDVIGHVLDADCTDKLEELEDNAEEAGLREKAKQLLTLLEDMPPK
eukprot:m.20824 g.20824  ORF g.20824 m.20824 type:complete len:647 (+) comp6282_c0_seq1:137-2077(+)